MRQGKDPSGGVLGLIKAFFLGIVRSLQDFGVSRRSIWEGGVGLFLLASVGAAIAFTSWVLGKRPGRYLNSYQFTISFPVAYGLSIGTPVRIRGVNVGSVVGIKPGMDAVDTMVEVKDEAFVVPRDALVEINQLGLIAETMIDITPKSKGSGDEGPETALAADGVASAEASVDSGGALAGAYTASPLDKEGCAKEGVLVCHRGRIQGQQGVSMDEFIAVCTRIAKLMDAGGMKMMLATAESAAEIIEKSKPLLKQATMLAQEVTPIIEELNSRDVLGTVQDLTSSASKAVDDINHINKIILTEDNVLLLKEAVGSLVNTLKNIENISGSVNGLTGDSATQANIKQLIQSLSRIIVD